MNNISKFDSCYGCGVCAAVCPKKIISLELNKDGFYQPIITSVDECVDCGLCLKVCSYHNEAPESEPVSSFASWSKDENTRKLASSGGTGLEIALHLQKDGYEVIGVRYNAEMQRAEHFIATSAEDLLKTTGSKYIQSYTLDAFLKIQKSKKCFITGTPCQIASIRRLIKRKKMEDQVVLMDFFCHGVPSMLVWNKYVAEIEKQTGPVRAASWRNKRGGWHDSWDMKIEGEKSVFMKKRSQGDIFYKYFLGDMCFNKACYKDCKFKYLNSAADIRIGDLWGSAYNNNEEGVTGVISFTQKGNNILHQCNIELENQTFSVVAEGQMKSTVKVPYYYYLLLRLFKTPLSLLHIYRIVQFLRIGTILKYKLHLK